ncbi:MAG TPA: ADOP family duplicated permease [Gemmatimonadaceae bacterium]|nr:ADOP family duplicated permease [Gemmatimonadaceae bacterium]
MNLRLALRDMARRPTFAAAIILTLTISLGATIAAFAFIDAVFLTRLPVHDQDRLVVMTAKSASVPGEFPVTWETRAQLAQRQRAFSAVTAFGSWGAYPFAARDGHHVVHVVRSAVDGHFFDVLGARAELGRLLRPEDDVIGAPQTVVLSDRLWRRDFGTDSTLVGRVIYFAREPHRVVGIAPPEFAYPAGTDAWTAVVPEFWDRFGESVDSMPFFLVGRLLPGVSQNAARTELETVMRTVLPNSQFYVYWKARDLPLPLQGSVTPFTDVVLGTELRPALVVLFSAVVLVLVIAWANIAGLLLGRGLARGPELAVRRALGASRRQLAQYLLVESALLAGVGGILGLALAVGLIRAVTAFAPAGLPMIGTAHIDPRVLAFALGITLLAPLAFGLAPALRGASQAETSRSVIGGPITRLARHALVAAQVALALVVLSGAALLGRTLATLQTTVLGFDPTHLLFFKPDILAAADKNDTAVNTRMSRTIQNLNLPITSSWMLPFSGTVPSAPYTLDGQPTPPAGQNPEALCTYALDDYFRLTSTPLLRGRPLSRTDDRGALPVAVVNEAFARKAWPSQDALGHRIHFRGDLSRNRWWTVVGVAADTRFTDVSGPPTPTVYLNPRQIDWDPDYWYALRTEHPERAVEPLERAVEASDHTFGISQTVTGASLLNARLARPRALAALFAALSATALVLAAVGLFGVLSAYIRERRREIAVRSALGATPSQLRGLVLAQTLTMTIVGIACGVPLALGGSSVLRKMVSDVRAPDALTILAIAIVLIGVVAAAAYGPTIRASRIDPKTALAE